VSFMPQSPLASPATWTGEKIATSGMTDWLLELSQPELTELSAAVAAARRRSLAVSEIAPANFELPLLGPKLKRIGREVEFGRGFSLIRGLPAVDLSLEELRLAFFGMSTYLGIPLGQSGKNDILGDVRNEAAVLDENTRGYKLGEALAYHNDCVGIVGLLCVRPARSGGVSKIVSATAVHNIVMIERIDLLRALYDEPCYYSWQGDGPVGQLNYYWFRCFSYFEGRLTTRWLPREVMQFHDDMPEIPRMSAQLREALEFTDAVANRDGLAFDMRFQPGDIQYLNDSVIWHSRTAYEDDPDLSRRRHLLRVWLNPYAPRPVAPDLENIHDALGDAAVWPRRRIYPVPVHDTW